MTSAKKVAVHDIKNDLRQHSKCFLAFKKSLNPIMNELVKSYSRSFHASSQSVKPIFQVGDHIVPKEPRRGIEHAVVTRIDSKNYYLKILCGTAIIPISSQVSYKLETSR